MSVLTTILTSASVLGNGFVLAVITRFKSLRTVPNILIANLALVDLFNAAINMPSYMIYTVLEAGWFRGKTLGIMTSIFNRVFLVLNLASLLAMTILNTYLAISFDAFKQFLKDPFGSSDFNENQNLRGNGGNRHDEVMTRRRNDGGVLKADSIQYSGERRNATIMTSVMKELDADLSSPRKVGPGSRYDEEKGKNGGEVGASNSPVQNLCQGKELDTEEVRHEVPEKCGLKNESRKPMPSSSRKKVHPLEASGMSKTDKPDGRKGEVYRHFSVPSLGNQRNDLSTGDKFENVVKAAWVTKE